MVEQFDIGSDVGHYNSIAGHIFREVLDDPEFTQDHVEASKQEIERLHMERGKQHNASRNTVKEQIGAMVGSSSGDIDRTIRETALKVIEHGDKFAKAYLNQPQPIEVDAPEDLVTEPGEPNLKPFVVEMVIDDAPMKPAQHIGITRSSD